MTSNLASEEIANYAVKLRDEAVKNYKEKMSDSQSEATPSKFCAFMSNLR